MKSTTALGENIMVKAPYNILFDIYEDVNGSVFAKVKNEFSLPGECGPINASEAGRHLAILGSIALSNKTDSQNYYLAVEAKMKRETLSVSHEEILDLEAKVIFQDKRTGEVSGKIFDNNSNVLFSIIVKYQILSVPLFSKFFKSYLNTTKIESAFSPYISRKKLTEITITKNEISATYGAVLVSDCEGHFEDYPALPVAIICNLFGELGLNLFFHHFSKKFTQAIVTLASINAKRLVFSGEHLTFQGAKVYSKSDREMVISSKALVGDEVVADAEFELYGIKNIEHKS